MGTQDQEVIREKRKDNFKGLIKVFYKKEVRMVRKSKLSQELVQWHAPIVPAIQEAEAGE